MSSFSHPRTRVLAIDPCTQGFGFAVLEGSDRLIDWGLKYIPRRAPSEYRRQIMTLIEHYQPEGLILEDCAGPGSRRCRRIRHLIAQLATLAAAQGVVVYTVAPAQVRHALAARTKHHLALAVVRQFPELLPRFPPRRKVYMSEDPRMNIFDAAALALAFFRAGPDPRYT